jgi:hypothetical protein
MNFVCAALALSRIARQIGSLWCRRYMLVTLLSRRAYPPSTVICVLMRGHMRADARRFNALSPVGCFQ